ncbi:MAG: family 4 glycosyl hydrolase [Acidimicrobiales bacterium]
MQVTIVGGGSYQWTPELMADLFATPSLHGLHLVLEDIEPEALAKMEALANRLNDTMGAGAVVSATSDQKRALEGADFVIVTISTGGFESMAVDLEVPVRYGIRQTVGDTVGPGGISRSLRNVPVLVSIAKDMEELCPEAWLLNITNPMTCLTRAVCRETSIKTVGLCHEVGNWCLDLAIALGKPSESVEVSVCGVNHFPVITDLVVEGEDGFSVLAEMVASSGGLDSLAPRDGLLDAEPMSVMDFCRRHYLQLTLLDEWGTFPAAGDRHIAEFLPWILTAETEWGASFNISATTIADRMRDQDSFIQDVDKWLCGELPLQTWQSGELPAPVIDSLITGMRRVIPANIPNAGQAVDLPAGVVVESMCVVDGDGICGRDQVTLRAPYAELVRRHVAVQELTVEAALNGDFNLAKAAFFLDPLAGRGSFQETGLMVEQLLEGTKNWLPNWDR